MKQLAASVLAGLLAFSPVSATAQPNGCPPGLAKKSPACVPPGLAKKGVRVGNVIDRDSYHRIHTPERYGLPREGTYLVVDGRVVRVDPDTRAILTILGAASELLD